MTKPKLAGGDTMNFWISDFREQLLETIRGWDFLLINDGEARMLSGENNLQKAAEKILDMGPSTLVIKRGEYGAMLFRRDSYFVVPGYLLESRVRSDRRGRLLRRRLHRLSGLQGIERARISIRIRWKFGAP